jgi:hypothetical protein
VPKPAEIDLLVLELDYRGDLREALHALDERVFDGLAKAPREGKKPLRRQRLSAKENDEVVEPSTADRCDRGVVQIFRKIGPGDLGPESAGYWMYLKRIARHRLALIVTTFDAGLELRVAAARFPCGAKPL